MLPFNVGRSPEASRNIALTLMNPGSTPQLHSERLVLRRLSHENVDAICTLANDWDVARWMGRLPHPYLATDGLFFLEQVVPREIVWIVQDRSGSEIFGVAGLTPHETSGSVELGCWLGRSYWHKGFATEASRAILEFAFDTASLPEVISGCFVGNTRSIHVLEKLGFRATGTSAQSCMAQGRELPHLSMSLTREMWISARRE